MSNEASTPHPGPDPFILAIDPESRAVGGKARSLARLAGLGLATPPAFVVGPALWRALRASGPALPPRLGSAKDVAALDAARAALRTAPFPAEFAPELARALDAVQLSLVPAPGRITTFAVRSSGDTEDRPGALGAGVYESMLRVPRDGVPEAIRNVLASFLTPAAWVVGAERWHARDNANAPAPEAASAAVLIHPFVEGDTAGTVAVDPLTAGVSSQERDAAGDVTIEAAPTEPTAEVRSRIRSAARAVSQAYGPVEIEWVGTKETVTFLQVRAYRPAADERPPPPTAEARTAAESFARAMGPANPGGPWIWDAVHNPLPLSPAQAGLVALVDERCVVEYRQQVVQGYLFFRPRTADGSPAATETARPVQRHDEPPNVAAPRLAFDRLRARVDGPLAALGDEPPLEAALDLYVSAYGPLFGVVGPACAAARTALAEFVSRHLPDRSQELPELLAGVASVARSRRSSAEAILAAADPSARQAAIDAYLNAFGDESPRWDVAEPTFRETPDRLLLLTAGRTPPGEASRRTGNEEDENPAAAAAALARNLGSRLVPAEQPPFVALVAAARDAVAVGEDDDALFARLQAAVRRALLAIGRRLVRSGRLDSADDVFYLPLSVTRTSAESRPTPEASGLLGPASETAPGENLRQLSALGRQAFQAALRLPPPVPFRAGTRILRGKSGARGQVVGRAVHHPSSVPLGPESVLVASTLLPTELPLLSPAAVVVETGQALGHVAAQARERGIPAVVGAAGALAAIAEGTLIVVDGDRGEVVLPRESNLVD